jgi:hypothetical protein
MDSLAGCGYPAPAWPGGQDALSQVGIGRIRGKLNPETIPAGPQSTTITLMFMDF